MIYYENNTMCVVNCVIVHFTTVISILYRYTYSGSQNSQLIINQEESGVWTVYDGRLGSDELWFVADYTSVLFRLCLDLYGDCIILVLL